MSEQNIIPSAPPLYPSLQRESVGDYRLKVIVKKNSRMKFLITGESVKNTSERRPSPVHSQLPPEY